MNLRPCLFALLSVGCAAGAPAAAVYNVGDYGAIGDGHTKNTAAIARAVAACATAGGGTVHFPAGRYLTGSIHLESNLTLDLDAGAELLYSADPADSPLVPSRWECTDTWIHGPLIYANGKENIAIVGRGKLNGQGENWWWRAGHDRQRSPAVAPARAAWLALLKRIEAGEQPPPQDFIVAAEALRPTLLEVYNCKNVLVEGVTLSDSPFWLFHPVYSENVVVRGVSFASWGLNGDGIDIDSCRDVRVSDSFFSTGDDCIVIKSGRDAEGRRVARPTEHVTVTNCVMYKGHGAIVIGSETSGDIRDIVASNIVAKGTDTGIRIKSNRGRGGVVENVRCDNFVVEDAVKQAIEITCLYVRSPEELRSVRTPVFRNFAFSNLTIVNAREIVSIHGLPEKAIEQLRFSDITASGATGFVSDYATDVELHHVRVNARTGSAFSFDHGHDLVLDDIGTHAPLAGSPVVRLANADSVWLHSSRAYPGTGTFLQVDGAKPAVLRLAENDFGAAAVAVAPVGWVP